MKNDNVTNYAIYATQELAAMLHGRPRLKLHYYGRCGCVGQLIAQ